MSFRIVDHKTGEILFDTMDITKLMEQIEYYEYEKGRPFLELFPQTSEIGEEAKITGRKK